MGIYLGIENILPITYEVFSPCEIATWRVHGPGVYPGCYGIYTISLSYVNIFMAQHCINHLCFEIRKEGIQVCFLLFEYSKGDKKNANSKDIHQTDSYKPLVYKVRVICFLETFMNFTSHTHTHTYTHKLSWLSLTLE